MTSESGVAFTCRTGAGDRYLLPHISCGGVGLFDFDNDGDLDIFLIDGQVDPGDGSVGQNRLFRQDAPWQFTDVTGPSGLGPSGQGMGCAIGDIDNDGDADVFVTNMDDDQLYMNNGDGTFTDVSIASGANVPGMSCSATFVDYDLDGYLDLYITQYVEFDPELECTDDAGRPDFCGPLSFPPVSDVLLHNNGDGTFANVSRAAGLTAFRAAGLGVVAADFNEDGWPDLFVANDGYDNHLWINRQDGTFSNDALFFGVALNMHGQEEAGMGVVAADLDNDLDVDLFLTHLAQETNTIYRNRGSGSGFDDATGELGLASSSFAYTGFGVVSFDIELDGDLDLAIANGRVGRTDPARHACAGEPWSRYTEPNLFYLNNGDGQFAVADNISAGFCQPIEISRGLAAGDLDNDGDLDLVVNNIECPARILRNDAPEQGHWIAVEAVEPELRRPAIGATVTIVAGQSRWTRRIDRGGSYLSSNDPRAHFGIGAVDQIDSVEVVWPDGGVERFAGSEVNLRIRLERGSGTPMNRELGEAPGN